jgi:predicted nucleic acid-binding protein
MLDKWKFVRALLLMDEEQAGRDRALSAATTLTLTTRNGRKHHVIAVIADTHAFIIAATAAHLGGPLISRDGKIRLSAVPTIW